MKSLSSVALGILCFVTLAMLCGATPIAQNALRFSLLFRNERSQSTFVNVTKGLIHTDDWRKDVVVESEPSNISCVMHFNDTLSISKRMRFEQQFQQRSTAELITNYAIVRTAVVQSSLPPTVTLSSISKVTYPATATPLPTSVNENATVIAISFSFLSEYYYTATNSVGSISLVPWYEIGPNVNDLTQRLSMLLFGNVSTLARRASFQLSTPAMGTVTRVPVYQTVTQAPATTTTTRQPTTTTVARTNATTATTTTTLATSTTTATTTTLVSTTTGANVTVPNNSTNPNSTTPPNVTLTSEPNATNANVTATGPSNATTTVAVNVTNTTVVGNETTMTPNVTTTLPPSNESNSTAAPTTVENSTNATSPTTTNVTVTTTSAVPTASSTTTASQSTTYIAYYDYIPTVVSTIVFLSDEATAQIVGNGEEVAPRLIDIFSLFSDNNTAASVINQLPGCIGVSIATPGGGGSDSSTTGFAAFDSFYTAHQRKVDGHDAYMDSKVGFLAAIIVIFVVSIAGFIGGHFYSLSVQGNSWERQSVAEEYAIGMESRSKRI